MKDILILDDVISQSYQNLIEEKILENEDFPFYLVRSITKENSKELKNDSTGFAHVLFNPTSGKNGTSFLSPFIFPLILSGVDRLDKKIEEILAGRIFLTLPSGIKKQNLLHVDFPIDHTVFLYYVNDSDGDTVITNLRSDDINSNIANSIENPTILKTISPKKGRMVIFDGRYYHASTQPLSEKRCVINFDLRLS